MCETFEMVQKKQKKHFFSKYFKIMFSEQKNYKKPKKPETVHSRFSKFTKFEIINKEQEISNLE